MVRLVLPVLHLDMQAAIMDRVKDTVETDTMATVPTTGAARVVVMAVDAKTSGISGTNQTAPSLYAKVFFCFLMVQVIEAMCL